MRSCPVCDTTLYRDREREVVTRHIGRQYRLCSTDHREQFEESPGEYT